VVHDGRMDPVIDALQRAYSDAVDGGDAQATVGSLMASYADAVGSSPSSARVAGGPPKLSSVTRAARKLVKKLRP
jgi:hypothetical protein